MSKSDDIKAAIEAATYSRIADAIKHAHFSESDTAEDARTFLERAVRDLATITLMHAGLYEQSRDEQTGNVTYLRSRDATKN